MALTTVSTGSLLITPGMSPSDSTPSFDFSDVDLNALTDQEFLNFAFSSSGRGIMSIDVKVDNTKYTYKRKLNSLNTQTLLVLNLLLNESAGLSGELDLHEDSTRTQARIGVIKSTANNVSIDMSLSGRLDFWRLGVSATGSGNYFDIQSNSVQAGPFNGLADFSLTVS